MKSSHKSARRPVVVVLAALSAMAAAGFAINARAALPHWIRNIEARTEVEAAFFRVMFLPGGEVPFRRPPQETRPALGELIKKQPKAAELYSLRALEDEQQLDFAAAEADWQAFAANSADKTAAQLALADFYHRRLRPNDEISALAAVTSAPAPASEAMVPPSEQSSWRAFDRIFSVIQPQGLSKDVFAAQYRAWIARYPKESSLYARFLDFLITQKDFAGASQLIAQYHAQFPSDEVFPVKAEALVEYRRDSIEKGLAVYEKSFQPLWSPELIASYFSLLAETHSLRKFLDNARAAQAANPEDLDAAARIFYYYQQQGKLDAAQEVITRFRLHKDAAHSAWTSQELYVCARLLEEIHSYPESARFYFALYNSKGRKDAQELALAGLANLLLSAPDSPIRLGAGELSMYRDIATMDQGPGYLNGILSLLLNTTSPSYEYSEAERRAVPYFHRAQAAQLLAMLDEKFPGSARRAELHAALLDFYSSAGESGAVIKGGSEFLKNFPQAPQRTTVALLMADAFARKERPQDEFAIYDSVLQELASKADQIPLGSAAAGYQEYGRPRSGHQDDEEYGSGGAETSPGGTRPPANAAFQVATNEAVRQTGARSEEYSRVLERYLARLVERKQIPQALGVLRRELDHNPNDPGLYERLAVFLEQNRLGAEQEEVYRRAMARFPDRSWYSKLARFYLREKRDAEFERLAQDAVKVFQGSDLERYFQSLVYGRPHLYLRLNLYAHDRFPHNPVFMRNLLSAYTRPETWDPAAWEALLRRHWFEEVEFRNLFFEFLSRTGKLQAELQSLEANTFSGGNTKWEDAAQKNPAAAQYVAQANLWWSHFENAAAPLRALAARYPADAELGRSAASVFRSLAYFEPANTNVAVKIEENLLNAEPSSTEILSRIGDIYADRERFASAAPYWERIPKIAPGDSGGYLTAATIYWDYFDFDNALRLLNEGRKKLGNGDLYAYEAGAIYEGKRDYARAIHEYVRGALASGSESPAANRLLQLARRPKYRELVDRETLGALSVNAPMNAVSLRVQVLEAQNRKQEVGALLDSIVSRTATIEQATEMETLAQQKSLESVRQHALEKQASLATDPVTRLQLRYSLAGLYESKKDLASAQRNYEALYRENPKILGVVRSTVDFYWRSKAYPQAISALQQAAKDAYPELSKQFTLEAARKSTEAKLYSQARDFLAALLKDSPYDAQYLAAVADTYAQSGDQQGLKQFYLEKIALFRSAPFSTDERKSRIAGLRRGLIPALTKLQDPSGAVDQYIEILNAFPEDESVTAEAALYAGRYKRQQQLLDFYSKTVAQSPRDFRWPMVLARIHAALENYPAAIEAYGKSIAIRPDRADFRTARAGLNERLMHFDEAVADYERLYELAYKDPAWMEKIAEARARQGKSDQVVTALKTAFLDNRPERPENYFEVARRLESWGMLAEARTFAEQGVGVAGDELLADTQNHAGAKLYVRIMTRLRQQQTALPVLQRALSAAPASLPVLKEQVAKQGIAAVTDSQWRERVRQTRIDNARLGLRSAFSEMGSAVARYFTPEEKAAFVQFVQNVRAPLSWEDAQYFALPLVQSAGLADQEAAWRYQIMMQSDFSTDALGSQMNSFVELQKHRLKFAELGSQLERFAPRLGTGQISALIAAADSYRSAGDEQNELRVLSSISPGYLGSETLNRFMNLLLARRPQQLVQIASAWDSLGQRAADFVVAHAEPALVHDVVEARGKARPAVWSKSYHGLVGLYFKEATPDVNIAFLSALGDKTIAERIGHPVDRNAQLAGDVWFYYGSRYGEWFGATRQANDDDFLVAPLEQSPASSSAYLSLADYYAETGNLRAAIDDYHHVLELAPSRADVHDRLALVYFRQGARAEAIAQWKLLFSALGNQVNGPRALESFWSDFALGCDHVRSRKVFAELKPGIDAVIRGYLRRNGNYRSNMTLRAAYLASGDSAASVAWLADLASSAPDPAEILSDIADVPWIALEQRGPIYRQILQAKQDAAAAAQGADKEYAIENWRSWQVRWTRYLVQRKQFAQAGEFVASLPLETRKAQSSALVPVELQIAAQLGTLDTRIAGYRADSESAPGSEVLRTSARQLFEAGDKQSARKILEFVFAREIERHNLVATNFLGLAEIRIASGDLPGALDLLHRLVLVVGNSYENLDSSAQLLERTGHYAEAATFLEPLANSTPWEPAYRLRLAKARIAAAKDAGSAPESLAKIASNSEIAYFTRLDAALALQPLHSPSDLRSGELNLLSGALTGISAANADRPFFYDARLKAAEKTADTRTKAQLLANVLADSPSRDEARVRYFYAAIKEGSNELALAAAAPLLRWQLLAVPQAQDSSGDQEMISADDTGSEADDAESYDEESASARVPAKLPPAQQAQLAFAVGRAFADLGRLSEAVPYLTVARKLEPAPSRRKEIAAKLADVRAGLRRERLNHARQPILHAALEQDRTVRPRLLARAAAPAQPAAKGVEKP